MSIKNSLSAAEGGQARRGDVPLEPGSNGSNVAFHGRANMAHVTQSGLDFGLGVQVNVLDPFDYVPSFRQNP